MGGEVINLGFEEFESFGESFVSFELEFKAGEEGGVLEGWEKIVKSGVLEGNLELDQVIEDGIFKGKLVPHFFVLVKISLSFFEIGNESNYGVLEVWGEDESLAEVEEEGAEFGEVGFAEGVEVVGEDVEEVGEGEVGLVEGFGGEEVEGGEDGEELDFGVDVVDGFGALVENSVGKFEEVKKLVLTFHTYSFC